MSKTGALLRDIRKALDLTTEELGSFLGVHRMTIGLWENGNPRLSGEQNRKLSDAGVNLLYIYENSKDMFRPGFSIEIVKQNILSQGV